MLFCTDGVSIKLFTQKTEESPDRQQELRTCSKTCEPQFKPTCGEKINCQSCLPFGRLHFQNLSGQERVRKEKSYYKYFLKIDGVQSLYFSAVTMVKCCNISVMTGNTVKLGQIRTNFNVRTKLTEMLKHFSTGY